MTPLLVVLFVGYVSAQTSPAPQHCPNNLPRGQSLVVHGDKCFQFVIDHNRQWHAARAICQQNGGDLAEVLSQDDVIFMMNVLKTIDFRGSGVWIGLTDSDKEGVYMTVSGQPATYLNWGPGEPTPILHNFEDCVLFHYSDSGHFQDKPCDLPLDNFPFVCSYDLVSDQQATATPPSEVTWFQQPANGVEPGKVVVG